MPTIYNYLGFVFLIFLKDHNPIHVHVRHGKRESVINIFESHGKVTSVEPRKKGNSSSNKKELAPWELKTAIKFVNIKAEDIVAAWKLINKGEYHQKPIKITRKIV